jgi:hypothetical protein
MNHLFRLLLLVSLSSAITLAGQQPVMQLPQLPASWELLRRPTFPLTRPAEAEALLDLVHTQISPSKVEAEFQRLRFPLSGILQAAGLRWERLHTEKQRFIGTFGRHMKMYDGFSDEFDLNIFLIPHLESYILLEREALDRTLRRGRNYDEVKADTVPFPCPPELMYNGKCISVECEVTPSNGAQEVMPDAILPIKTGTHDVVEHSSFGTSHPSMGVMGVWCADCNHNCRPEVHPIELMWWMSPGTTDSVVWNVVSLTDASKRFPDWAGPVEAKVEIPLVFDTDLRITLLPILVNGKATFSADPIKEGPSATVPGKSGNSHRVMVMAPSSLLELAPKLFSTDFSLPTDSYGHFILRFTSKDAFAMKVIVERI